MSKMRTASFLKPSAVLLLFAICIGSMWQASAVFAASVSMNSSPRCVSRGVNLVDCVALGQDNAVWYTSYNGTWSNWGSLGGSFASAPAIVSWSADRLPVYVRGTDNRFYHNVWHNGKWSGWDNLLGQLPNAIPVGNLACFSPGILKVDCFTYDQDGNLWRNSFDPTLFWGTHWSNWQMVPEPSDHGSGLGAYSFNPESIGIVTMAPNGTLVQGNLQGYAPISSWTQLPSVSSENGSDPSCVGSKSGAAYCAVLGQDGKIWSTEFDSGTWQDWTALPGTETLASGPTIVTTGFNRLDVFARGSDNGLWVNTLDNGVWSGWSAIPITPIG